MYDAETWAEKKTREAGCGGNVNVKMDEWSNKGGQNNRYMYELQG